MIKKISQIITAIFFYTIFTLVIFWDPIINKFGSIQWDAIGVHFFNLLFSSQTWHTGTFPLWTPYIFNGFPQAADLQVAIFYPINLIISSFTVFSAEIMQYQLIFHYFLAGFFAFLLARHISEPRPFENTKNATSQNINSNHSQETSSNYKGRGNNFIFSLGAGLIYAFSGFMVGHGSHVGMQNTSAWLPLLFLLLMRALEPNHLPFYKKLRDGLLCGLFLGIAILAGHFQMALYMAYGLGFYFAFDFLWSAAVKLKTWLKNRKSAEGQAQIFSPRQFIVASKEETGKYDLLKKVSIISSVYIIAFLISAVQLLPTYELTAQSQRADISLEMSQTESLNPDSLLGLIYPNHNNVSHGGDYTGPWDRTQNDLFISITILILSALGAIFGIIKKETRKLTIFFVLLGASSLIYSLGKYGFLQKYYYQFVPFFDKIRAPSNMILLFDLAIIGLAAVAGRILQAVPLFSNGAQNLENSSRLSSEKFNAVPVASLRPPFSFAKLLNFLKTFAMFSKRSTACLLISLIILGIISAEIYYAALPNELLYARKSPDEITKKPWIAENIQSEYSALDEIDKFKVFKVPEFQDNSTQMWQIYAFDGYNPLALQRYGVFVDTMVKNANLIDLAGIKYLPCEFIPERAATLEKVGNLCINNQYYPRAFFVNSYLVADDPQDAIKKTAEINPKETLVLEENPQINITPDAENSSNIEITESKPGYWKLQTQNDNDAFLFFSQTNYPGWISLVDGVQSKIYQADYLFQAIYVPRGEHEIIFEFKSPLLKNGAILTIIGLILVLLGTTFAYLLDIIYKNIKEK